jgi:hypothetical protein
MGYLKRRLDRARCREVVRLLNAEAVDGRPWEAIPDKPPRGRPFVRFSTRNRHPGSGHRRGIFSAAYAVLRKDDTDAELASGVRAGLAWFEDHLAAPDLDEARAIFLFKSQARDCMKQIWSLIESLRDAGVWVEMQTVTKPGRIVYEDEHQVAAIPWADSGPL